MYSDKSGNRDGLLATKALALVVLLVGQGGYANDKTNPTEQDMVKVNRVVLQELIEERCETEATHRLAQDNPDSQTKDQFTYLCHNRWQVRLQVKD